MKTQVKVAIERAGGVAVVASHFGISPVSVYEWIKRGLVPADRCPEIEKFSDGAARCEELNGEVDWQFVRATSGTQPTAAASHPPRTPPNRDRLMTAIEQPVLHQRCIHNIK